MTTVVPAADAVAAATAAAADPVTTGTLRTSKPQLPGRAPRTSDDWRTRRCGRRGRQGDSPAPEATGVPAAVLVAAPSVAAPVPVVPLAASASTKPRPRYPATLVPLSVQSTVVEVDPVRYSTCELAYCTPDWASSVNPLPGVGLAGRTVRRLWATERDVGRCGAASRVSDGPVLPVPETDPLPPIVPDAAGDLDDLHGPLVDVPGGAVSTVTVNVDVPELSATKNALRM